jgi:hypothetical protein
VQTRKLENAHRIKFIASFASYSDLVHTVHNDSRHYYRAHKILALRQHAECINAVYIIPLLSPSSTFFLYTFSPSGLKIDIIVGHGGVWHCRLKTPKDETA